ncbi:hypothetical protein Hanom_Chr06g00515141 [Helianthus anomalus]
MSKYVKVGSIKKSEGEGAPETSAAEPSTAAATHVSEPTEAKEEKLETSITTEEGGGAKDE